MGSHWGLSLAVCASNVRKADARQFVKMGSKELLALSCGVRVQDLAGETVVACRACESLSGGLAGAWDLKLRCGVAAVGFWTYG